MKKLLLLTSILLTTIGSMAQSVGINTTTPHSTAILDVKSNTKGVLLPRTSTISRLAIVNPAKGLILYDTTASSFYFYSGTAWQPISAGNNGWSITGNPGTNPATNFIGTTDNQPLRFRVNNLWAGEINSTSSNVFFGVSAGNISTSGQGNMAMGDHALFALTEGNFNVANGTYALSANTSGYNNAASGAYALSNNTTGYSNTAVGRNALFANSTGNKNVAIGDGALLTNTT